MTNMIIKKGWIKNFRNIAYLEIDFGNRTEISGRNASGKTTIHEAFSWCLTGKMATGSQPEDIKPFGDIDSDTSVRLLFEIGGEPFEIEKINMVNIDKKTGKPKGSTNRYFTNGILRKAEKDFRQAMDEIASEEDFLYATSPQAFLKLATKDRRKCLFNKVGDLTNEDVIATNLEFEKLRSDLKNGSPEEVLSNYRYKINGRSRNDKGIKGKIDEIPARIDEQQKLLSTKDFDKERAELDAKKDVKTSEILMLKTQLTELSDKQAKVMELKFKANDIEYEVTKELRKEKDSIAKDIISTQEKVTSQKYKIRDEEARIKRMEESIVTLDSRIAIKKSAWQEEMAKEFVANDTCPTCGQKIPKAKIDSSKSAFAEDKKARCNMIASSVNEYTKKRKECAAELEIARQNVGKLLDELKTLEDKLKELRSKDAGISEHKKIDNEEHKAVLDEIEKLNKEIESVNAIQIRNMVLDAQNEVSRIDRAIINLDAEKQNHDAAVDRIEQLQRDRKYYCQEMADIERKIDLIREFQMTKCSMITEKINSKFNLIKWRLFEPNLSNDGFREVCDLIVNGANYETSLNNGMKILADIDLVESFQRIAGIKLPIWVDDSESLSSDSMETITSDSQLIFLKVTDSSLEVKTI